jgi:cyanophycinase
MKKKYPMFLTAWIFCSALLAAQAGAKGSLVIMGGNIHTALERVYRRFIALGGGVDKIRLAIIPAASGAPAASGSGSVEDFVRLGVPADRIRVFPVAVLDDPATRDVDESKWSGNGFDAGLARDMLDYTAVYFVGGDQIRYNQTLKKANGDDSPLLQSIRQVLANGGVVGGSSAGAAMMCDPMICDGASMKALVAGAAYKPDACPEAKGVSVANGLGFFSAGLVDQHFLKRGRIGRLLVALYAIPKFSLGLGIDEDTALVCQGDMVEVLGASGVVVVDAAAAKAAKTLSWSSAEGLRAKGILLHYLEEGDRFDVAARTPLPRAERRTIAAGKQENADYPLATDLFGRDIFRAMLVDGLAENQKDATAGIAFSLDAQGRGQGSEWTLRKGGRFAGLYASIDGNDTYSVIYVALDVAPVTLRVKKIR